MGKEISNKPHSLIIYTVKELGEGVLDVPPEVWGHLHEPFREGRTASLFGLRNSAVSSENMSLGKASLLWLLSLSTGLYLYNY